MEKANLQDVPLKDIILSGDNARKIDQKAASFEELKASIASGGLRIPVAVRRHPKKKGKFELRAGERRYRACKALGLETIPAIVYAKLGDADAIDLTFVENKFREDLKPMEEAAEVALLLKRMRGDAKRIASKIGKSEKWVRIRANIHAQLAKCWRQIFSNADKYPQFNQWSITHLTIIARLPEHIQRDLHSEIKGYWSGYDKAVGLSVRGLETMIGRMLHLLSKSKWDLNDQTLLPAASACSKCTKRSGHQPFLWFDAEEQAEAGDQCLDGHCWAKKVAAWLQRRAKQLQDEHASILFVTKDYPTNDESQQLVEQFGTYLPKHCYKTVPKSARGAVAAMYVNGAAAGQLTYVKPTPQSPGTRSRARKVGPTALKVRRAQLEAKRWAQMLVDLKAKVGDTEVSQLTLKDKVTGLIALVAFFGNSQLWHARYDVKKADIEKLLKSKSAQHKAMELLWQSFIPTLRELLTWSGPITQTPKELRNEAIWIAQLIGADDKAMFKGICSRKGFTEPKSWKDLNPDGTPKQQQSKKAKDKDVTKGKKAKQKTAS